ncbi:MAG: YfhO family protein [Candidatus Levybacteria bacterium]|nr:YfhO family protein [Candidatus Levybacteria bacterium]
MKKHILRFWPIIFIFSIWFIFASPFFLKNKVPFPSTYQVNNFAPWSTNSQFWGPVKNGAMPDIITQIYPWRHLAIEIWKSGGIPLWNPYSFSGTPLLANYQSAVLSPFNILFFIFPFVDAWSILVLIQPLLAAFFMYFFVRSLNRSKIGSLISSISFMFCGFITVWMGYATLPFAILFLPLSLFCIEKYYITRTFKFLLLLTISIPLSFFSGHFQISLYFLSFIGVYVLYKFIYTRRVSSTFCIILSVFFGFLMSMPQILPSAEFYMQSFRSTVFEKGEIIPWGYFPTFLAPDFFGNPVTRNDWFGHYAEWNSYIGVLPLMLAIYAIIDKKKSQTFLLFGFAILVLLLAFPTPLQSLLISIHFPVLSTSAAGRIVVLYSFLFAALSAFGFDRLLSDINDRKIKKIIVWLICFSFLFLILWCIALLRIFIPMDKAQIARSNLVLPTLIFGAVIVAIFVRYVNSKVVFIFSCFLLAVVSFDMLRFAIKWMPFDPRHLVFPETSTTKAFPKISNMSRVLGNLGGEAAIYYNLPSVEGYDALYIKNYAEFIGFVENGKSRDLSRSVVIFPKDGIYTPEAVNLLDIRYIVHKLADDRASWTFPYWTYPDEQFKLIYRDDKYEFYENMKAFPHAFLVGKYRVVKGTQKAIDTMFNDKFDLSKEIILEEDPNLIQTIGSAGVAKITRYEPNNIDIEVTANNASLLYLADNFYNGWKAEIDGKEVSVLKANYTFRAIPIKTGKHFVRFFYDPASFRLGLYMALGGLIGVAIIFVFSRTRARKTPVSS